METPATLIIGNKEQTNIFIDKKLKNILCNTKSEDCGCSECRKIESGQHEYIVKITPQKKYVISDIEIIFEKIKFELEDGKQFFFILENVHLLTSACANKLLKTLEEPPTGYKFFLITNNENLVIPTIKSRCLTQHLSGNTKDLKNPIMEFFIGTKNDPIEFERELKNQNLPESETVELINEMIHKFHEQYVSLQKNCSSEEEIELLTNSQEYKQVQKSINFLKQKLVMPPQQGGSILFWRNIFLNFPRVNS